MVNHNSRTLSAVLRHTGNIASPNSEMFVFTSAGASDVQTRPQLSQLIAELQTHVRFWFHNILIHWNNVSALQFTYFYASDKCGSTPNDGSLKQTARLAYASSGNVLFANSSDLSTVSGKNPGKMRFQINNFEYTGICRLPANPVRIIRTDKPDRTSAVPMPKREGLVRRGGLRHDKRLCHNNCCLRIVRSNKSNEW